MHKGRFEAFSDAVIAIVMTIMVVQTLLSMPLFFRFSRVIWLYLDQSIDPAKEGCS